MSNTKPGAKSVSVPRAAYDKAVYLRDKIIDGTEVSISKVLESILNKEAKKYGYKNGKSD